MSVIFKLKQIFRVAWMEYRRWIVDPRLLIVGVLCVFSKTAVSDALISQADEVGTPLHFLEPFIAMGNSSVLLLFFPFVYLILMSDFPSFEPVTLLVFSRTGKNTWFCGQLVFLLMSLLSYLLFILGFSCVCVLGSAQWRDGWSDAITKYSALFPEKTSLFTSQFISSNIYNQLSIFEATLHLFCLLALYLAFIAMLLMLFQLLRLRTGGLLCCIGIIGIGAALCETDLRAMWAFPMANSLIWKHFQQIAATPIYPLWGSYLYFLVGIALLVMACHAVLKRSNVIGMV